MQAASVSAYLIITLDLLTLPRHTIIDMESSGNLFPLTINIFLLNKFGSHFLLALKSE